MFLSTGNPPHVVAGDTIDEQVPRIYTSPYRFFLNDDYDLGLTRTEAMFFEIEGRFRPLPIDAFIAEHADLDPVFMVDLGLHSLAVGPHLARLVRQSDLVLSVIGACEAGLLGAVVVEGRRSCSAMCGGTGAPLILLWGDGVSDANGSFP